MEKLANYINGRLVEPANNTYIDNYSPTNGRVYSLIPDSDDSDVDNAVKAARLAFSSWGQSKKEYRSKWMLKGYYGNSRLTYQSMLNGFYKTGDLGYIKGDHLYLNGRINEMINVGGRKVNPVDIENILVKHKMVIDCACVGRSDKVTGETVIAYIVPVQNADVDERKLHEHLIKYLPNYMCPKYYEIIKEIPRTKTGKTQRNQL